jgi:hypothetical protein
MGWVNELRKSRMRQQNDIRRKNWIDWKRENTKGEQKNGEGQGTLVTVKESGEVIDLTREEDKGEDFCCSHNQ